MEKLPPPEVREWLLDCLRMLIRCAGTGPLARPPLAGPDALGPWTPDARGLAALGRRMLDHVGLRGEVLRVRPAGTARPAVQPPGPLALTTYDDGVIRLEIGGTLPGDRALLAGGLAGEVARVWRVRHGFEVVEPDLEDQLTGLTAVYLGFGLLLAGMPCDGPPGVRFLLDRESVAWLLAAQHLARGGGRLAAWSLGWRLDARGRRAFAAAITELRRLPGGICERLRLPDPEPAPGAGTSGPRELEPMVTSSEPTGS